MLTKFKDKFNRFFLILAKPIIKYGVSPNIITITGFIFSVFFLIFCFLKPLLYNLFLPIFFILSAVMDGIDGAIARLTKNSSKKGAFIDSTTDRAVDSIYIFSLFLLEIFTIEEMFLLLVGNLLISYTRARAEALGVSLASIGIAERAERIIITFLILILFILQVPSILIFLLKIMYIAAVYVTILQRIYYAVKRLE